VWNEKADARDHDGGGDAVSRGDGEPVGGPE